MLKQIGGGSEIMLEHIDDGGDVMIVRTHWWWVRTC